MMNLILLLFCLYSGSFFAAAYWRLRFGLTLAPFIMLCVLILYGFAWFKLLEYGLGVLVCFCILLYFLGVMRIIFRPHELKSYFFTPGMAVFTVLALLLFVTQRHRLFSTWDEFSHWGVAAKLLFNEFLLPCYYPQELLFASYPPGMALTAFIFAKFLSPDKFQEWACLYGMGLFALSLFLPMLLECRFERKWQVFGRSILLFLLPLAFFPDICSMYVDLPLGGTLALALLIVLYPKRFDWRYGILLAVAVSFMFMIKQSGFGLAYLPIALAAWRLWRERSGSRWPTVAATLGLGILPWLLKSSWVCLVRRNECVERFSGQGINALQVWRDFVADPTVAALQVGELTLERLFLVPSSTAFNLPPVWFWLILMCGLWLAARLDKSGLRRRLVIFSAVIPVAALGFIVTLVIYYVYTFPPQAMESLASFDRYTATLNLALAMPALTLILLVFGRRNVTGRRYGEVLIIILVLALASPQIAWGIWRQNAWATPVSVARSRVAFAAAQLAPVAGISGEKVAMIAQDSAGFEAMMLKYLYPHTFVLPELFSVASVDALENGNPYGTAITPDEWVKVLMQNQVAYIYLQSSDACFKRSFGKLFEGGEKAIWERQLYKWNHFGKLAAVTPADYLCDFSPINLLIPDPASATVHISDEVTFNNADYALRILVPPFNKVTLRYSPLALPPDLPVRKLELAVFMRQQGSLWINNQKMALTRVPDWQNLVCYPAVSATETTLDFSASDTPAEFFIADLRLIFE